MNNPEETLKQSEQTDAILQAIAELPKKIDDNQKDFDPQLKAIRQKIDDYDAQFEAIRQEIVHNGVSYDRLKAEVLLLRADVKKLTEEVCHSKRALV